MSKQEPFAQKIEDVPFELINQFLLFQYSWVNISAKRAICRPISSALERV